MALHHRPDFEVAPKFDPVSALRAYHDAIEARDLNAISEMLLDEAVYQSKGLGPVKGRKAIVAAMAEYFRNFPDHRAWDTAIHAKGEYIACSEWQLRATNIKTRATISRHGIEQVFFNANGQIVAVEVEDLT